MLLSIAIQHHPAFRQERTQQLVDEVVAQTSVREANDVGVHVVADPDPMASPSPWRCYRHALVTTPNWATHRLILQDDVILCRDFVQVAVRAIEARPDRIVVFHVSGNPYEHANAVWTACQQGRNWADLDHDRWCPVVATCYPATLIDPIVNYVDSTNWGGTVTADDEVIGRFCRLNNLWPCATVPSLVEHPDDVESVMGRRAMYGQDRGRVAACFIDPACDPNTIVWTDP